MPGCGGVGADVGLDGGVLVGGDDVLIGPQRRVVEAAGVEVEHPGRLGSEVGASGEDPGAVLQGLIASADSQRQIVVPEIEAAMPFSTAARARSGGEPAAGAWWPWSGIRRSAP